MAHGGCESGQICPASPVRLGSFVSYAPLRVVYTAAGSHCSPVAIRLFVDGALAATTPFVEPGGSTGAVTVPWPTDGKPHALAYEGEGKTGGCNPGSLYSWAGTLSVTYTTIPPVSLAAALSFANPAGSKLAVGGSESVTGTVTAEHGDVSDVGVGLVVVSGGVRVTKNPPGLNGFALPGGASKSFVFTLTATSAGTAVLKLEAGGNVKSGRIYTASPPIKVTVGEGALSIADVARGSQALSADVRVKLTGPASDASGCDPNASYDFSDPNLASVKQIGSCSFQLVFVQPGTGIYHVGLKATEPSGAVVPVSVDQYGQPVDGTFTLVIDSCAQPRGDDLPDVVALVNSDEGVCDVAVGSWDSDAKGLVGTVIADAERESTLAVDPIPVDSVDPSDWPSTGASTQSGAENGASGWIPVSEPSVSSSLRGGTSFQDAISLARHVLSSKWTWPLVWGGRQTGADPPNGVPPYTVISAHGLWYVPSGLMVVPAGDKISTYVPLGTDMNSFYLGEDLDTGHIEGLDEKYLHVYTPGQLIPNFTFLHFPDKDAMRANAHTINPASPIALSDLIHPDEGDIVIAACAGIYIPADAKAKQVLERVPVYAAGAKQPEDYKQATINSSGGLDTSAASAAP